MHSNAGNLSLLAALNSISARHSGLLLGHVKCTSFQRFTHGKHSSEILIVSLLGMHGETDFQSNWKAPGIPAGSVTQQKIKNVTIVMGAGTPGYKHQAYYNKQPKQGNVPKNCKAQTKK